MLYFIYQLVTGAAPPLRENKTWENYGNGYEPKLWYRDGTLSHSWPIDVYSPSHTWQ